MPRLERRRPPPSGAAAARGVIWHDLECGSYRRDLVVWHELADRYPGPVLDVGAGTGRVALELARAGHSVFALDFDPALLAELERRAGELPVRTLCADAREFVLPEPVGLCLVPMQTIQLLGGVDGRAAFLACAGRQLLAGGAIAAAIVEGLETFEVRDGGPAPLPDMVELGGAVYFSQPTAVRRRPRQFVLERRREVVDPSGARELSHDRIALDRVSPRALEREGERIGLRSLPLRTIPATPDHAGSEVVTLVA